MLKVSIVVGNPKSHSRTLKVAESLVAALFEPSEIDLSVIDLADHAGKIFSWPNEEMNTLNESVASSDLVVFASPTYKATYTGLLKAFLDRYPANGLSGVTAIPLLTGGSPDHFMGPTVNLAPLLAELGAVVPGRGFYFVMTGMDRLDEIVAEAAEEYRQNLQKAAALVPGLKQSSSRLS